MNKRLTRKKTLFTGLNELGVSLRVMSVSLFTDLAGVVSVLLVTINDVRPETEWREADGTPEDTAVEGEDFVGDTRSTVSIVRSIN